MYIFVLESLAWTGDAARKTFGMPSREFAETTKQLAFNQGVYNLFLAIEIAVGIVFFAVGAPVIGATLVFVGTGSMLAAGLVLASTDRSKLSAALKQLVPPAIAIVLLAVGLAI